ncbi:unnamed protein product [Chrysoparadoxa australica]
MDDKLPRISRRFAVGAALVTSAFDVILLSTMGYGVTTLRHFLTVGPDGVIEEDMASLRRSMAVLAGLLWCSVAFKAMSTLCAVAYWRTRSYLWLVTARGRADLVEGRDAQEPGLYECSHEGLGKATSKAAWRWAVACGGCAAAALIITSRSYVTTLMLSPEDGGHEKCDPLDATLCVTPWPSSYYLTADSSTPTGWILDLADKSLPLLKSGKHLSPASINKLDGFSTLGPALFYLEGMSAAGLARPHDLGSSLADDSLTVLYDTKSMERIPHFVDLDTTDASHPLAVLQPARPLQHNTRYVVAVKGVKGQGGEVLRPTPGFQQLLDAVTADKHVPLDIELRQRAEHFIAAVLPFIPVSTPSDNQSLYDDELQLAWDFTTASERSQLGLLKQMREHMESVDIPYRVVKVEEEREAWDEGLAGRTVWGRMTVPAYVDTEDRRGGVVVERGGDMDGKTKTFEVGFVMVVPGTVLSGDVAVEAIVQYGHGLFSTREEVKDDFLRDLSEAHGWILSATDWRGMSKHDLPTVAGILMRHTSDLHVITDNLMQSFINQEALLRLLTEKWREIAGLEDKGDEEDEGGTSRKSNRMRSASAPQILGQAERDQGRERGLGQVSGFQSDVLLHTDDEGTVAGRSGMLGQPAAVDSQKPDAVAATGEGIQQEPPHVFYGISEGGVFGAGYSAFSTLLTRSVLSVSGTPFCLLLPRSRDFIVYRALLQLSLHGARDIQLVLALMQLFFDTVEAAGWRAAPVTPQALERHVLLQAGLGDAEVTTIGAEILARAYGAVAVNPPWDYPVWGVPESKDEGEQKDEGEHMGDEGEQEGGGACSAAVLAIYDYVSEAATVQR